MTHITEERHSLEQNTDSVLLSNASQENDDLINIAKCVFISLFYSTPVRTYESHLEDTGIKKCTLVKLH